MNQQDHTQEPEPDRPGGHRARSRRRWWAVGLAGVTGLALTTVGLAATSAVLPGGDQTKKPTNDRPSVQEHRTDERGKRDDGKSDDPSRGDKGKDRPKGTPVPCDTDTLIAAITLANARGGAILDLAENCTYLLSATIDGAGLPAITTPITLNGGKHTAIERAAAVDLFRILTVNAGGDLTLNHLTIAGGHTAAGTSGGGVLVNIGGTLTANDSAITRNISGNNGGGILNEGTTVVTRSRITRNIADQVGGGIYSSGRLEIVKSQVDDNTSVIAGGVLAFDVTIRGGSISGNHGTTVGGLFVQGGVGTVVGTRIIGNTANVIGGVAVAGAGQLKVRHVKIADNTATVAGGLFVQGGGLGDDSRAVVEDSAIERNTATATTAGGVHNAGQAVLRHTKITDNQADLGGGIYNTDSGTLALYSTKVVKNIAVTDGGGILNVVGGSVELNTATGTVVVKNRPNNCVNVLGCQS
ncbi:right-handed parallel beta-helix repeat-containing protein [Salinispora arenicola]|uniref:right-handed parallel beta-helix repeat-containing protein n=1 Tax=Salinispora arenicola TaxID=168697 RepID=UPI00143102B5|nr:right-handed parallel beta-helix repeat-containing protein [Salinispora arenicola]NIL42852.1 right-handed parallel beta-helix repeat-containing protein [Salinispora arenicola]